MPFAAFIRGYVGTEESDFINHTVQTTTMVSLERLLHRATKFPNPAMRFGALRTALAATEDAISHQAAQLEVRTRVDIRRRRPHPDDLELDLHELRTITTQVFPQVFRGGFLVSLWSLFESTVKDLGEYTRKELKLPFGLQDLRAGDFLEQTERYFLATVKVESFPDKTARKQIERIKTFRNAISHHNGNLLEVPKALLEPAGKSVQRFTDLHHEFGVPTAEYNARSLDTLASVSEALAEAVYTALHPNDA